MAPILAVAAVLSVVQGVVAHQDASRRARKVEELGRIEAGRIRREGKRAVAERAAQFGASGIQLLGTPIDVLADEAAEFEEAAVLHSLGRGFQARDIRSAGRQALISGFVSGAGIGVSAFGQSSTILGSGRTTTLGSTMRIPGGPGPAFPPSSVPRGPIT